MWELQGALLPPLLQGESRMPGPLHYSLTSHTEHDYKPSNGPLGNPIYSKAHPHWDTNFLNELAQKLRDHRSIRVVSAPVSEMRDRYRGQSAPHQPLVEHYRTLLALYGQLDRTSALLPKEPRVSTTQEDYRRFSRSELSPPSALDAPPIKGTLTKSAALSRLPPHKAPPPTTSQLQLPRPCVALPHGGRSSLYTDSFSVSSRLPKVSATVADYDRGNVMTESGRGLLHSILEVPKMYGTENQTYGKGRIVLV
ncbi:uncharacterized protein zgc:193811 isoform X2 [Hoplias malabaricus]|uniref:uncharacterized protein zgc:193811 isoform X2 n=1 Tax=Hoplias malabaricus TaxID=27720 RepID=UPI0034632BEF